MMKANISKTHEKVFIDWNHAVLSKTFDIGQDDRRACSKDHHTCPHHSKWYHPKQVCTGAYSEKRQANICLPCYLSQRVRNLRR